MDSTEDKALGLLSLCVKGIIHHEAEEIQKEDERKIWGPNIAKDWRVFPPL